MKTLILPFFSAQDKETRRHLLDVCCVTKICVDLSDRMAKSGHETHLVLPWNCSGAACTRATLHRFDVPFDKTEQRNWLPGLPYAEFDLIVTHNELSTAAIRKAAPRAKIVHWNHLLPLGPDAWMKERWQESLSAADAIVVMSSRLFFVVTMMTDPKIQGIYVVPYSVEDTLYSGTIDFLFNHRCSANNYTRHQEFVRVVGPLKSQYNFNVAITDPTKWLRSVGQFPEWAECPQHYVDALKRTRYIVCSMAEDEHGGVSVREAMACGAVPIALKTPAYLDLLGDDWPFFFDTENEMRTLMLRLVAQIHCLRNQSYSSGYKEFERCFLR